MIFWCNLSYVQTLDYLQRLYEKKLVTYPRTDSRYLTEDMAGNVPALAFIAFVLCGEKEPETVLASQVCDSGKVSDHHAIVPTKTAATGINISDLPTGERNILLLVARSLLRAVCPPYRYAETVVTVDCGGTSFTAKGKTVLDLGWRTYAENKADAVLPDSLTEGAALAVDAVRVKTGQTAPPIGKFFDTGLVTGGMLPGTKRGRHCEKYRPSFGTFCPKEDSYITIYLS